MKVVASSTIEGSTTMETWKEQQKAVATGVTIPAQESSNYTYVSVIEELETENRMLRARNERLTMAMKQMERILMENTR